MYCQPTFSIPLFENRSSKVNVISGQFGVAVSKTVKGTQTFINNKQLVEIDNTSMLRNAPHICRYLGTCPTKPDKNHKMSIELIIEEYANDLSNYIGRIDVDKLLKDISIAMYISQSFNISHHDIKPMNIFYKYVGGTTEFYLGDFGLGRLSYQAQTTAGSLGYMAPELFDNTRHLPFAHDSFSLGITVCNAILKVNLIPKNYKLMTEFYQTHDRVDISTLPKYISPLARHILLSITSFNPTYRYTPQQILELYNVPLPDLNSLIVDYPEIPELMNKESITSCIASEITHRYMQLRPQTNHERVYTVAYQIALLRLNNYIVPEMYWESILRILYVLDYRIYNPRLTSILKTLFY